MSAVRIEEGYPSYEHFLDTCFTQGVTFVPALQRAPVKFDGNYSCYQPSDWCGAIALMGDMLQVDRDIMLASGPVPADAVSGDVEQQAFRTIINTSIGGPSVVRERLRFGSDNVGRVDACSKADHLFGSTLRSMKRPHGIYKEDGITVGWGIVNDGQDPVAIVKDIGESSLLSLEKIVVDNTEYPAGSLFKPDFGWASWEYERHQKFVCDVGHISRLGFMRLTAYALEPERRPGVFAKYQSHTKAIRQATIADIKQLATEVMDYSTIIHTPAANSV